MSDGLMERFESVSAQAENKLSALEGISSGGNIIFRIGRAYAFVRALLLTIMPIVLGLFAFFAKDMFPHMSPMLLPTLKYAGIVLLAGSGALYIYLVIRFLSVPVFVLDPFLRTITVKHCGIPDDVLKIDDIDFFLGYAELQDKYTQKQLYIQFKDGTAYSLDRDAGRPELMARLLGYTCNCLALYFFGGPGQLDRLSIPPGSRMYLRRSGWRKQAFDVEGLRQAARVVNDPSVQEGCLAR